MATTRSTQREGTVLAAHVRHIDPPQFVAESLDDLFDLLGQTWSGEQCDNCGNSLYTVRYDEKFDKANVVRYQVADAFYVACTPDTKFWADAGLEIPEGVGCGTEYRLRWYDEDQVQF